MNSDGGMDRALRNLAPLRPARSLWPEVEKHLDRRQRRQRRQSLLRYLLPGVAASLAVVAVLLVNRPDQASRALEMQKTVDNAVRDARSRAGFSNLQLSAGRDSLEALLVSAKPRRGTIQIDRAAGVAGKMSAEGRQSPVNEF